MSVVDGSNILPEIDGELPEGSRVGRFVVVRDIDGTKHALAAGSVAAACQTDDGTTMVMLPGGKLVQVPHRLDVVLDWLDGRGPR